MPVATLTEQTNETQKYRDRPVGGRNTGRRWIWTLPVGPATGHDPVRPVGWQHCRCARPTATRNAGGQPVNLGIPEGEAATRRHIEAGLKAGEIDPITGRKVLYYHDPMVPGKKFEAPGKSPFMDMMLVPAYAGGEGTDASTVTVSPRIQQNLGLRTGEVTEGRLAPEILAVGAIAWNERDQVVVQARAMGFVEKLHVRATLDPVARGKPCSTSTCRIGSRRRKISWRCGGCAAAISPLWSMPRGNACARRAWTRRRSGWSKRATPCRRA